MTKSSSVSKDYVFGSQALLLSFLAPLCSFRSSFALFINVWVLERTSMYISTLTSKNQWATVESAIFNCFKLQWSDALVHIIKAGKTIKRFSKIFQELLFNLIVLLNQCFNTCCSFSPFLSSKSHWPAVCRLGQYIFHEHQLSPSF